MDKREGEELCSFYISCAYKIQHNSLKLLRKAKRTLAFKMLAFAFPFKWSFAGENTEGNSMDILPGLNTALCSLKFL